MSIVRQGTLPVGSLDHAITLNVQSSGGSHFETVTDTTPYLHRASPQDVASSMNLKKVVGGTIAWNQKVRNGNFESTSGWGSTRGTQAVSNNELTYTVTQLGGGGLQNRTARTISSPKGHKVFVALEYYATKEFKVIIGLGGATSREFTLSNGVTTSAWNRLSTICQNDVADVTELQIGSPSTSGSMVVGDTYKFRNVILFDLTQMFGSTIADYIYSLEQAHAGDGVAWFKALFPKAYYPYNAGELMSVKTSAHKMVGFNQLNLNRTLGTLTSGTGATSVRSDFEYDKYYLGITPNNYYYPTYITEYEVGQNRIKVNNDHNLYGIGFPVRVLPNTTYRATRTNVSGNMTIGVGYYDAEGNSIGYGFVTNATFTTPSGCYTATILFYSATTNTVAIAEDLNLNLSWDGSRDGEYEPYVAYSYPLDSDLILRGIPKLDSNNELYYDGDTYASDGTVTRKYGIRAYTEGDATDGSTMITDGTNTVYKLITPTTESADAYTQSQRVGATEEFVDGRTVEIPVGNVSEYKRLIQGDTP